MILLSVFMAMSLPQGTAKFILKPACRLPPLPRTHREQLYITTLERVKKRWNLKRFIYISVVKSVKNVLFTPLYLEW